ncbi:MAG TPA: hypothetical protein VMR62_24220 [Bryobacteraceae bacterium]|nr:hypothetical protein [Bryobacteraceae bacterium]
MTGVVLYVPGERQVQLLRAPAGDPFSSEPLPINMLQRDAPARCGGHRVRLQGVLTLLDGQTGVYICDGHKGIRGKVQVSDTGTGIAPGGWRSVRSSAR